MALTTETTETTETSFDRATDPKQYQVTLVSKAGGGAFGYGMTEGEAEAVAEGYWHDSHGNARWEQRIVERVSQDGTHYEEVK